MPNTIGAGYAEELERLNAQLSAWLAGLDEQYLHTRPAPDDWTVMENLAHVVEMEPYWTRELLKVVNHAGSPFGRTIEDPDRIAYVAEHGSEKFATIGPRLAQAGGQAERTLRSIPDDAWDRIGVHSRRGEMTLREIVEFFLTHHLREHLDQAHKTYEAVGGRQ